MYFNTNVDSTNIDKEFAKGKKNSFKWIIFIGLGCILILGLIFIFIGRKKVSYYIDLSGNREITIYKGDIYIEPGYTARDSKGNDLTDKVVVNNMIDISTIGTYEIIYTLNNTEVKRIINVLEKPTGATIMYLKGSTTIYLKVGDTYQEPGYKVIDSVDGNLGDKVTVTGRVDTSKVGTYKLIYSVTNNSGVTTSKQRVIVVMDSNISLTLNNEDYTNKNVNINIYVMDNYFDYLILPNGNKVTSKSYTYEVSDNGEYKFIIYNKLGEKTEKTIRVKNIDKVSPTGSCSGTYGNGKSNITIKSSDNIGIQKYVIDGVSYVSNNITLDREVSSVSVRIYDKALNFKDISCSLSKRGSSSSKPVIRSKNMEIHFIASGHYDDAILIRTDNKVILIDSGRWDCREKVTPYLKELGISKIDLMIGSHLDNDHIAAQGDILSKFIVDKIYYPDDIFNCVSKKTCVKFDQENILEALNKYNKKPEIIVPPKKIIVGEMELYFLAPNKITSSKNDNSFIFILKFYNNTFMFTGDAGTTLTVNNLQNNATLLGIDLKVDMLKYPHHGNASISWNTLDKLDPEYVIVPNNGASRYPNSDNRNMLSKKGIKVYRQSDSKTGNIVLLTNGNKIEVFNDAVASSYKR